VLVALAAPIVLGEPRARHTPLALAMALGGTAAMVLPGRSVAEGRVLPAVAFGGASALFYAATVLMSRHLAPWFGDRELLSYHALLSAVLLAAAGGLPRTPAAAGWLLLGSLPSALAAGILFYAGLRRLRAEEVGVLTYVEPMVATLVGWLLFSERLPGPSLAGGALVLVAGILVIAGGPSSPRGAAERADADAKVGPPAVGA
jgi:drug/metabolite transporter (DMT)-like permease